jgi:hypothetical protein
MRTRAALVAILAALSFGAASTPASAHAACGAGYTSASLPWGHKCLRAGEFCKVGNAAYRRYGYVCPVTGHLRRR